MNRQYRRFPLQIDNDIYAIEVEFSPDTDASEIDHITDEFSEYLALVPAFWDQMVAGDSSEGNIALELFDAICYAGHDDVVQQVGVALVTRRDFVYAD